MMVFDSIKAIDYLQARNDVDMSRIATMGLSMGSTMAWWLSALDTRIKLCIDLCCMTDFQSLIESQGLNAHGIYYFVPNLLKHFSTAQINALISPRPHLSLNGNYDVLTPPKGLDCIDSELKAVYAKDGASEAWEMVRYNTGHFENADMRARIIDFLKKWL
jgi:acetyl esterase/lipase